MQILTLLNTALTSLLPFNGGDLRTGMPATAFSTLVPTGLAILSSLLAPAVYCLAATEWSQLLSVIAGIVQSLVTVQLAINAIGNA